MTLETHDAFDPALVIDQLYDIALEPETLVTFIDAWTNAGLDAQSARQAIESMDKFDQAFQAHLNRAGTFLARAGDGATGPDLVATLTPFDSLAAFIMNKDLQIVTCNQGAMRAFEACDGMSLKDMHLPPEALQALKEALADVFQWDGPALRLVPVDQPSRSGPALFQIRKVVDADAQNSGVALVITTQYHWQDVVGTILEETFKLTTAEQGVVRGLVEGLSVSAIAALRGTSDGTVRGQIKSLMAKMNARSQSEVIRLVLSLRDISDDSHSAPARPPALQMQARQNWLQAEVWKPFKSLILPDGRKMDYHEMGPANGKPVLFSHMGYSMARWHAPMIKLAFRHALRVICPMRAGYGHSDNLHPKADVLAATRADTLFLLNHLGISRLPYVVQGNDLVFAADLAAKHPEMVSEIIGLGARPCLPGDQHYAGMDKFHRFFFSTARHAPHLLHFTAKAAVAMARRIGPEDMFRHMNKRSRADLALLETPELLEVLKANAGLSAGKTTDVSQAYTMELLVTEADWSDLLIQSRHTKAWFVIGAEDPASDMATIAEYRATYPWIDIDVVQNAGQMLIYQTYQTLIPRIAEAAKRA